MSICSARCKRSALYDQLAFPDRHVTAVPRTLRIGMVASLGIIMCIRRLMGMGG